jgi:hypothetical protein
MEHEGSTLLSQDLSLVLILSQINPVHYSLSLLLRIRFNIMIPFTLVSSFNAAVLKNVNAL